MKPAAWLPFVLVVAGASAGAGQEPARVVVQTRAPLYVTPEPRQTPLAVAEPGVSLEVLRVQGDWYLVEFRDRRWGRRVGYLHRRHVVPPATPPRESSDAPAEAPPKDPEPEAPAEPAPPPEPDPQAAPAPVARPEAPAPAPPAVPPAPAPPTTAPAETPPAVTPPAPVVPSPEPDVAGPLSPVSPATVVLSGYVEWRRGDMVIADGQRLRWNAQSRVSLDGAPSGDGALTPGRSVRVRGIRRSDGSVLGVQIAAETNADELFETDLRRLGDRIEVSALGTGLFHLPSVSTRLDPLGAVVRDGPDVSRALGILERLRPPTVKADELRLYVIHNPAWSVMALPNGSVWVHSGLVRDTTDDELAIILGHALAHYTHEHPRRATRNAQWIQAVEASSDAAIDRMRSGSGYAPAPVGAFFGLNAWRAGYTPEIEAQADRVGMRYAYEAGFDVEAGISVWSRLAGRVPDEGPAAMFFVQQPAPAAERLAALRREIALNYREGRNR